MKDYDIYIKSLWWMSSSIPIFIYLARHSNIVQKWPDLHGVENLKNGMKMKMKENENKNENLKMAFNQAWKGELWHENCHEKRHENTSEE